MRITVPATILLVVLSTACRSVAAADDLSKLSPAKVEEKSLGQLIAGSQWKAEEILLDYAVARFPDLIEVVQHLAGDRLTAAKDLLSKQAGHGREGQRVLFLLGAFSRSRFEVDRSYPLFAAVALIDPQSVSGQCAILVNALDAKSGGKVSKHAGNDHQVNEHFAVFTKLVEAKPDDLMVRWMLAVQCRAYNRNEEGVGHYKIILKKWSPGPVLVHQTYANLLDELCLYDEALVERHKTVKLEPASWSYDGLGNTLDYLGDFQGADEAHAKAVQLNPNAHNVVNWAHSLFVAGRYDEAIEKCQEALGLNSLDKEACARAWRLWGDCLDLQAKPKEALEKYDKARALDPDQQSANHRTLLLSKGFIKLPRPPRADPGGCPVIAFSAQ